MKRVALMGVCVLTAFSAFAARPQGQFREPSDVADVHPTYSAVMKQINEAKGGGPRMIAPNVVLEGSESGFVIPIAGSGGGANGTFFRSEGIVMNNRSIAQNVAFFFFPLGGGAANCTRPSVTKRLEANTWYLYTDLVHDIFGVNGFGAVIALGVNGSGNPDSAAMIDGNSRIWTPQPGTSGTTSQNFPSMSLQMPGGAQWTFGLRSDEFYRSNWGIFNYDTAARTFDVTVDGFRGQTSFSTTIDACSLVQSGIGGGPYGSFLLTVNPRDGRGMFFSYGSSVDNVTGDAWSVTGRSF